MDNTGLVLGAISALLAFAFLVHDRIMKPSIKNEHAINRLAAAMEHRNELDELKYKHVQDDIERINDDLVMVKDELYIIKKVVFKKDAPK